MRDVILPDPGTLFMHVMDGNLSCGWCKESALVDAK